MLRKTFYISFFNHILIYLLGFTLFLFSIPSVHAQTVDTTGIIKTVDYRGHKPLSASIASIKASRNDLVVVLIRGGDQELIDNTKGQLKALVHNGYNRIGVILSDLNPDEQEPVLAVVSDGTIYASIKRSKADTITMWKIYNLVRDAYQDNIWPKMGKREQKER